MNYEILGNILKEARSNAKYTQPDIASKLGVTFQNVSSWERGKSKIDIDTLIRLCNLYNIDFVEALERASGEHTPSKPEIKLSSHEGHVIEAYRNHPEMRAAVDRLLKIEDSSKASIHKQSDAEMAAEVGKLAEHDVQDLIKSDNKA